VQSRIIGFEEGYPRKKISSYKQFIALEGNFTHSYCSLIFVNIATETSKSAIDFYREFLSFSVFLKD
jgi:hypothetical protein